MKIITLDFKSVRFINGKMNGAGFFALKLVDFLLSNEKTINIINNSTEFFNELNISMNEITNKEGYDNIYINPFFSELNIEGIEDNFSKLYFYIHGTRLLEMPYDSSSYKYFKGIDKYKTLVKQLFFKKYYINNIKERIRKLETLKGSVVMTPSEHSKFIIKTFVDLPISVVPPFVSETLSFDEDQMKKPSKNYILILNSERWVKNSYRFIKAFSELKKQSIISDVDLVVVGKPVFYKDYNDKVIFLDYVERNYLEFLIKNAYFLAYPSLNEGFGYPPLDSFKYGVPVLCSSISATNIVYNGNVVFVNPFSEIEIKSRILYLIDLIENNKIDSNKLKEVYSSVSKEIEDKWDDVLLSI